MSADIPPSVPNCVFLEEKSGLKLYDLERTLLFSYDPKIKIVSVGEENDLETRNIFLMGATGAGKSCLLNAFVNYLLGVKFEDNYRYVLKDEIGDGNKSKADSQTEYVVGYLLFMPPRSNRAYNYLIIDTPGLKDSKGKGKQHEVIEQIGTFLQDVDGVEELHCIGFVVNGTIARIQKEFKDVVEEFCSMFGENAKDVIRVLISFGYMKRPPVCDVFESSCLKGCKTCKFDNASLYTPKMPIDGNLENDMIMSKCLWNQSAKVYDVFFDEIDNVQPVSLGLTREALNEIAELHNTINCFKVLVDSYLSVQVDIKQCEAECKEYQLIMNANEQWQGTVQIKVRKHVQSISPWVSLTSHSHNCETCMKTCKYPCNHLLTDDCPRSGSQCGKCSCPNENHVKSSEIIDNYIDNRAIVYEDKKKLYDKAKNNESFIQEKIVTLRTHCDDVSLNIDEQVHKIIYHSNKIKEQSLSHKELSSQALFDQTFLQIKTEHLIQSNDCKEQGYVSPILEDLAFRISTLIGS